uniref:Alpha-type protein kinase domain-containing protein n=1 Tax=Chlamydomonas leiostraca TaxID=1034604 RepID=A0A7S0WY69_9CHLO|mmetsp:Transcript_35291/g.89320  ORF Transcript_35291/g.89320 Transcript_35291/m.89320 type:complete len:727 (+) Transcript_35291:107-2287(+)
MDRLKMDSLIGRMNKLNMDSAASGSLLSKVAGLLAEQEAKVHEKRFVIRPALATDLCFILDATVSMSPNRDAIVKHLEFCVHMLTHMRKHSSVRVAVVAYRDFKITPRYSVLPFTSLGLDGGGTESVRKWLRELKFHTDVSQDFPEDVHGGLEQAGADSLGWSAPSTRVILHIADAPGHGKRLKDSTVPNVVKGYNADDAGYADYDADGSQLRKLLLHLRENIKVNQYGFWHVPTKKAGDYYYMTRAMVERFREAAGDPAWVEDFDWDDERFPLQLIETVGDSVRSSISFAGDFKPRGHTIVKEVPDWSTVEAVRVQVTKHNHIPSITKLLQMIDADKHLGTYEVDAGLVKVAPHPFACGKARLVYYGRYYPEGSSECQEVVLKEFIAEGQANKAVHYKAQMETHTVASYLADQFNAHAQEKGLQIAKVKFVECTMVCITTKRRQRFMLMEQLCSGEHAKFNNNCGSVNAFDPQPHLQAFSHWSYEVSDRKLMVVDVQGFKEIDSRGDMTILLSDPAMHCVSQNHFNPASGRMNLRNGFDLFLHSHLSPEINDALQQKLKIRLHGPVCEALLPSCAAFRSKQDAAARDQSTGRGRPNTPFRGFGRRAPSNARGNSRMRGGGNRSPSPQRAGSRRIRSPSPGLGRMICRLDSASTNSTVDRRAEETKRGIKIHDQCRTLLRTKGIPCPNNLFAAIKLCADEGLITAQQRAEWHAVRVGGNAAKHQWD